MQDMPEQYLGLTKSNKVQLSVLKSAEGSLDLAFQDSNQDEA